MFTYRTYEEEITLPMNKYGLQIRDRWKKIAPTRYAAIENPQDYFEELGAMVASQIEQLSMTMAGEEPPAETYLEKVARLTSATRLAEEQVLDSLTWPEVELSATEARLEWEATRPSDQSLADWAINLNGQTPFEDQLQTMATEWMLPESFFTALTTASNPWTFLATQSETLAKSAQLRYQRHLNS